MRGQLRRLTACALVALVAACGGDDEGSDVATEDTAAETTTTTVATPTGPAAILVADGHGLVRIDGTLISELAIVDGTMAVAHGAGVGPLAAEVDGELVVIDREEGTTTPVDVGAPGVVLLHDVAIVDGEVRALYGVRNEVDGRETDGSLWLRSLAAADARDLGQAYGPEHHTGSASIAGDLVATSAITDLTETVEISALDGSEVNEWTPTIDLPYAEPPLIVHAVLGPDARTIAWLSGPDTSGSGDSQTLIGTWEVVVADLDGTERSRLPLDVPERPVRLDYDGERLLVSLEGASPLVIDVANGSRHTLPLLGMATFDR